MGQLITSSVWRGLLGKDDQWSSRIPSAIQWVWLISIIVGVSLALESPWWLVRQGYKSEAMQPLKQWTHSRDIDFDAEETIAW